MNTQALVCSSNFALCMVAIRALSWCLLLTNLLFAYCIGPSNASTDGFTQLNFEGEFFSVKIVTNSIIIPFSFQMEAAMVRMWGNTVVKK